MDYRGNITVTKSGKKCLPWKFGSGQVMSDKNAYNYFPDPYKAEGREIIGCRNPWDSTGETTGVRQRPNGPWCWTQYLKEWEYCDVPICRKSISHFNEANAG